MLFVNVKFPIFYFLFCKQVFGRGARKGNKVHGRRCTERQGKSKAKKRWLSVQLNKKLQEKGKSNNGENLDSSCSIIQPEESANSANTLNIESISKRENLTKSSIVIASSSETSSAGKNGRKLDMILSEISKLNSKLSEKTKPR